MDSCENRDCIVYDGKRVAVKLLRPKEYYLKRALALAVTTLTLMLVGAVVGIAVLRGDIIRVLGNGGPSGDLGGAAVGEGKVTEEKDDSPAVEEIESEENGISGDGDRPMGGEAQPPENETAEEYVIKDLSCAELGDAYIINHTRLNPDTKGLLEMGFRGGRYTYSEAPVVLILHTHTSEGYFDADKSDPMHILNQSVLTVGERIAYKLSQKGIPAVHCSVIHDGEGDAYLNAADTIKMMMKIYPTIEYVIDLHRAEEIDGDGKPVRSESASGSSQIRVTVSSRGVLTGESLALALCLRRELNSGDRRLCMPVVLTDSKYNADLSPYYLKVDVGTQANGTAESLAAGEAFAEALAEILKK